MSMGDKIQTHQRKLDLLAALSKEFDARIAAIKTARNASTEAIAKAEKMKEAFMDVARAQPDEAFAQCANVNAVLVKFKPLVKI